MIRQILQLKLDGYSKRGIARSLGISRNTVKGYLEMVSQSDLSFTSLLELDESEFYQELDRGVPYEKSSRYAELEGWFEYVERELERTGVTRQHLWLEYKARHPNGYQYSRFCELFNGWREKHDVPMVMEHKAGDKFFLDFAGKKLHLTDPHTGKQRPVEVLVGVMGASGYTYCEALESQQLEHFIAGVQNGLQYLGGVPAALVPDNLKSAVKKAHRYEPELNEQFASFAHHYATVVLPTRSRKPRDKALVENAVAQMYRRIYAPLRDEVFYSLKDLNERIGALLQAHNESFFQGRDYSRKDLFERVDAPALSPLPYDLYEVRKYARARVQKNSHVLLGEDKHYYSVPHKFIGRKVKLIYTHNRVEIWYKQSRITFHRRVREPFKHSSHAEHLPQSHRFIASWSPEKFREWAAHFGPHTQAMIDAILARKTHPEKSYKSCLGILSLAKKADPNRMEAACKRALYYESISYKTVKNILDKAIENMEESPPDPKLLPQHNNIRGSQYYV